MNTYKLTAESRALGAIGETELTEEIIHAENIKQALDSAYLILSNTRELISIKAVERVNKWVNLYVVQEYAGDQYKWEDSTAESSYKEARARLKEYRDNSSYPSRMITRKVINPEWSA